MAGGSARSGAEVSLRQFVYKMRKGDTIYAKEGPLIVGKGTILGDYRYSPRTGLAWPQQCSVDWQDDFSPLAIQVGGNQQYAIRALARDDVRRILQAGNDARRKAKEEDALEGELQKREASWSASPI